jgi:hypothetical protein
MGVVAAASAGSKQRREGTNNTNGRRPLGHARRSEWEDFIYWLAQP